MSVIGWLKSMPIDLGQGNQRFVTKGKEIALGKVPKLGKGKRLLDIGCREGAQSEFFRNLGYDVVSIDIDPVYEHGQIVDCNRPLPFRDHDFDVVWSSEVIEHLVDPSFSIAEMRRVTRPSGTMVLTTPNSFAFYFCLLAAIGLTPQKIQRNDHLHFFDLSRLRILFPDADILGFIPFTGVRPTIRRAVGTLSPTFVITEKHP